MTTVVVAIVGALATVLATVIPVLVVSERRRLLRVAKDEWDLVEAVDDEETEQHLRAAMRYTALRYRQLATVSPVERARRRVLVLSGPGGFLAVTGAGINVSTSYTDLTSSLENAFYGVGIACCVVGLLLVLVPFYRWRMALRDEVQHGDALAEERLRSIGLREALDEAETLARERDAAAAAEHARYVQLLEDFGRDPESPFRTDREHWAWMRSRRLIDEEHAARQAAQDAAVGAAEAPPQ